MYGFACKILLESADFFRCFKVNFNLQKTFAEVNLLKSIQSIFYLQFRSNVFWLFRHFFKFDNQLHSLDSLCFKKVSLLARGPRYRKKPPARATNQIAGNRKITLVVHK